MPAAASFRAFLAVAVSPPASNVRKALVIDGDSLITGSLELMLQAEGFVVETASDVAQGASLTPAEAAAPATLRLSGHA